MTTVLVSPNAFKGTLSAIEASAAMAAGVSVVLPAARIVVRPIADGGDGSVDALLTAGYTRQEVPIRLPDGSAGMAAIARSGDRAVVEVANSCGLVLTPPADRDPLTSSTTGLGDAVRGALDAGASDLVLCVGGSASTDGGVGLLLALGARVLDASGRELPAGGGWLASIAAVDLTDLDPRLRRARITVATDVQSPLAGPNGAAVVFAPQKGATPDQVRALDAGLRSWSAVVARTVGRDDSDVPGAGAAGGTAFAALAVLGAEVVPGADFIARAIGLDDAIGAADLVLTGEGSLDAQSLLGKGAVAVARAAQQRATECVMICGRIDLDETDLRGIGLARWGGLTDIASETAAMDEAAAVLTRRTIEVLAAPRPTPNASGAQ